MIHLIDIINKAAILADISIIFLTTRHRKNNWDKYHINNLKSVISILLENDYPLDFIFDSINDRIQYYLKRKKICTQESNIDNSIEWIA